ncbi:hypothetical protein CVT24_000448 [Panaeolus cyanescens]|uniref:Cas1p 10 TM acyl transferase domain-containing protein n=1 Tax=Panaeolus cyanescens TaxID=181874 RepID=A0A409V8B2_9AGAR|nr:hypothetical protein CVT24_000448 [Panaeolus cyanescens]
MSSNFRPSFNPAWPHFLGVLSVLIALLFGVLQLLLQGFSDPLYCSALLNRGSWLDTVYKNWQPDGCILHTYSEKEASLCLQSQDVIFVGDSVTRKLFFQVVKTLDASLPGSPPDHTQKHSDYSFETQYGTNISFTWDPFLNSSSTQWLLTESQQTRVSGHYGATPPPPPAFLVLGSGLWYLRYSNSSGGMIAWERNVQRIFDTLTTHSYPADSVIFLPVEQVIPSKLSPERAQTMHPSDIEAMNSDLYHRINPLDPSQKPFQNIHLPLVFNQMIHESLTEDGLHFDDSLLRIQASILLNLRCNNQMPKVFPFDKTCCNSYPWANILQFLFLFAVLLSGPYLCYIAFSSQGGPWFRHIFSPFALSPLIISAAIGLIYVADRTAFWSKEQKEFNAWSFGILCLLSLAAGLLTVKKADSDLGFLNREQTDEWKGWMQVAILIYHYFGASKISGIYNPIRLLVSSYLFMTGYGHATFYLKKADFGFLRVAQVLIRLNLFTVLLAYTMNTQYVAYYFTPLVTMWYLVIYATMLVGARFNDRASFFLLKILLSAAFMTWLMNGSWLLEMIFDVLYRFFAIRWSMRELMFRTNLDIWIVYVGMATALAVIKVREHRLTDHGSWQLAVKISAGASALIIVWFFVFELTQESKFTYNKWHPYISPLPVLAFVILRNSSAIMRSAHSEAFAFFGRCSLEAFIIQYHLWLAADSKGILIIIPGTLWRPVNFVLISIIFVFVCERAAFATAQLTNRFTGKQMLQTLPAPVAMGAVFQAPEDDDDDDDDENAQELEVPERSLLRKGDTGEPLEFEPDTPIRPQRWVERLANSTAEPSRARGFRTWIAENDWIFGYHLRAFMVLLVLWIFNVFWVYPEGATSQN